MVVLRLRTLLPACSHDCVYEWIHVYVYGMSVSEKEREVDKRAGQAEREGKGIGELLGVWVMVLACIGLLLLARGF